MVDRRAFLRGVGIAAGAVAASGMFPAAAASAADHAPTASSMTAYGGSVCLGKGLGKKANPSQTWFEQVRLHFAVPGVNSAISGSQWPACVSAQQQHPEMADWLQIFWGGHADAAKGLGVTIPGNVQTMVDFCTGPYLVMGTTNGHSGGKGSSYYRQVFAKGGSNAKLAAAHPGRYLDVQRYLTTSALADAGITPTPLDEEYLANGQVPFSLLAAGAEVHLNLTGQTVVAQRLVIPFLTAQGWLVAA